MEDRIALLEQRVSELERRLTPPPAWTPPRAAPVPAARRADAANANVAPLAPRPARAFSEEDVIERWMPRVGALAIVVGAAFGFRYAVERGLIGPGLRVLIGIVVGIALVMFGERARIRRWHGWAQAVAGGGVALVYLSVWAASELYGMTGRATTFVALTAVSAAGVALALRHDSQALSVVAVGGAFVSPFVTEMHAQLPLGPFLYMIAVDVTVLVLGHVRRWRILQKVGFTSSWLLFGAVAASGQTFPRVTFAAQTVVFAMFASVPLVQARRDGDLREVVFLVVNSVVYAGAASAQLSLIGDGYVTALWLALAVMHGAASAALPAGAMRAATAALAAVAWTVWVPLAFGWRMTPLIWIAGAAFAGEVRRREVIVASRALAGLGTVVALAALQVHLPGPGAWPARAAVALALVAAARWGLREPALAGSPRPAYVGVAHAAALAWLTLEITEGLGGGDVAYKDVAFAVSGAWSGYAAALMAAGVAARSRTLRVLATALFGLVLLKLTMQDVWMLDTVQRLVALVGLGTILLTCSLMYQRFKSFLLADEDAP